MVLCLGVVVLGTSFTMVGLENLSAQLPDRRKVPEWIRTLEDPKASAAAKIEAAKDLGRLGMVRANDSKPGIPALLKLAENDKDKGVRRAALEALGQIALEADKVVPVLRKILVDDKEDYSIRAGAATGLGYMGADARDVIGDLRRIAGEFKGKDLPKEQQALSRAAGEALKRINPGKK
jgi:HEAT repeat protein